MQRLKVTYRDGREVEAPISPRAEVEYERHFDKPITTMADRLEYYYWLAWKALDLSGEHPGDFETFLSAIDNVEAVQAEPADPTPPPQPTGD